MALALALASGPMALASKVQALITLALALTTDLHNLQILKFVHNFIHYQGKLPAFSLTISPKITRFTPIIHVPKTAFTVKFTEAAWDKDLLNIKLVCYGTPSPMN